MKVWIDQDLCTGDEVFRRVRMRKGNYMKSNTEILSESYENIVVSKSEGVLLLDAITHTSVLSLSVRLDTTSCGVGTRF